VVLLPAAVLEPWWLAQDGRLAVEGSSCCQEGADKMRFASRQLFMQGSHMLLLLLLWTGSQLRVRLLLLLLVSLLASCRPTAVLTIFAGSQLLQSGAMCACCSDMSCHGLQHMLLAAQAVRSWLLPCRICCLRCCCRRCRRITSGSCRTARSRQPLLLLLLLPAHMVAVPSAAGLLWCWPEHTQPMLLPSPPEAVIHGTVCIGLDADAIPATILQTGAVAGQMHGAGVQGSQ
jgi:hypothetical protein